MFELLPKPSVYSCLLSREIIVDSSFITVEWLVFIERKGDRRYHFLSWNSKTDPPPVSYFWLETGQYIEEVLTSPLSISDMRG
uniref:Transposase n=1 Tax=Syphacia muris TaxID=451379 RepID=A0A0N5B056_9BILA